MKFAIISGALALATFTGCAVDNGTPDSADTSSTEQDATLSLLGCTLTATKPNSSGSGIGDIFCPANYTISGRLCLEQLVTGGWENVGGIACQNIGPTSTGNTAADIGGSTGGVSFYTAGRFYRARTWATVSHAGQTGSNNIVSDACKGDGGSGCN